MKFLNLTLFVFISIVLFFSGCDKDDPVSPEENLMLPTVVTADITEITPATAIGGGEVTEDGGSEVTARGVVWCTSPLLPTLDDNKTNDGNGLGSFTSDITDLQSGTNYCVRAYATNSEGTAYGDQVLFKTIQETGTVTDIDGNEYETVKIGDQWWMAENLKVTRYNDGTDIDYPVANQDWMERTAGAYAIYPHGTVDGIDSDEEMVDAYGKLYNWYAVDDDRGLCPEGWGVPSDEEWTNLGDYLGGDSVAGAKLKSTRTVPDPHPRWNHARLISTNESGFSGLPGSQRMYDGEFWHRPPGFHASIWTSTEEDPGSEFAWSRFLTHNSDALQPYIGSRKRSGRSVRCMMYEE